MSGGGRLILADFATSPSGYVAGIVVPALLVAIITAAGFAIKRQINVNADLRAELGAAKAELQTELRSTLGEPPEGSTFGRALVEQNRALAILVTESTNDRDDIGDLKAAQEILESRHTDLATSVAVLADRVNQHIHWATEENARLRDRTTGARAR